MMMGCTPYSEEEEMIKAREPEEIDAYYECREEEYIPLSER